MALSLLEHVRQSCGEVADRASHVRIRYDKIHPYAGTLAHKRYEKPQIDPASHYLGHEKDTVAFLLTLDAINFGSGYSPYLKKRKGMSGYFTIASRLSDCFKKRPLTPQDLERITASDCFKLFKQNKKNPTIAELMDLFAVALNDLGRYVIENFQGDFAVLVEAAGSSALRLVEILVRMPFFKDVEYYQGMDVAFFKRAQILAADLSLAFDGKGLGAFHDLHRLTMFADNLVPHVLRVDGILEYEENLAWRIDHEEIIPSGSAEEVEIRACSVQAVELLVEAMGGLEHGVTAMLLDNMLWNRGQQPYYKMIKPRHRTRTVFY